LAPSYGVTPANLARLRYEPSGTDDFDALPRTPARRTNPESPAFQPPRSSAISTSSFTADLPAGWEQTTLVSPEQHLREIRGGFSDGGIRSAAMVIRAGPSGRAALVFGEGATPRGGMDGGFDANLRSVIPNLVSQKRANGSRRILIGRGSIGVAGAAARFVAAIPLPHVTLYAWCMLPEADVDAIWPEFVAMIESVRTGGAP
jgi:hypothetical protein